MYNIYLISARGTKKHYMECATEAEAYEVCEEMNWEYKDENNFVWRLEVQ